MLRIMYFTADWCGPCKIFGPRLAQFSRDNNIPVARINADDQPALAHKWDVFSLPTTIWFRDSDVVHFESGALTEDRLSTILSRV